MSLKERDKKNIWHPLTQHKLHPEAIPLVKAQGALLYDEDGNEYIDGIASWYTSMYGHCNEHIVKKVQQQMTVLDQVVFSGFTHEPAVQLSERLLDILPENQSKLFFSDNGSTATEVGIKMALQYHFNKSTGKNVLIALENGFHGDTFGAMSASGLSVYNGPFEEFFITVERIPVPDDTNRDEVLQKFKNLIGKGNVAGFIFEPLVQGAAAMKIYDAEVLELLMQLCKEYDIVSIADEVMTGFGKTGTLFASDQIAVKPDIICLSKALTAGLLPMAVTSCSQHIYDAFYHDDVSRGFFHGHTYTANPPACAAALAGIELLLSETITRQRHFIAEMHTQFDHKIRNHAKVLTTRQLGVIYALELNVEMERYGSLRDRLFHFFMKNGVFLRPLGNTIYILPPYVINEEQLNKVYTVIRKALDEVV
ncbi:adenosylmethionine--8-amino-7-oxononanoate transaminase [Ascidiimonas aurantiaca]|uniref:adenosylmethionine--8-amino-7-oxononanoate transaminase n=1 Tax=Ascidiimonas aurantiaca TaxID=1685432 RepID=UPI0030EE3968